MLKIILSALFLLSALHASSYRSIHKGKLLNDFNANKVYMGENKRGRAYTFYLQTGYFTLGNYTMYDKGSGTMYYPNGWRSGRAYIPSSVTYAEIKIVTKPNTHLRVHLTFVGSDETAMPVIDHDKAVRKKNGPWNMKGTIELHSGQNAEGMFFDTAAIAAHGGGWLYYDVCEDLQSPEDVAQPEQYGYTTTSNPTINVEIGYKINKFSDLDPWIARTNFLTKSGDPSEANTGSIKVIDRPKPGTTTTVYTTPSVAFQHYDSMADYLSGSGSSGGGSVSSPASSSSESSGVSSSVSSSSSSSFDGECPAGQHWVGNEDFGGCEPDSSSSSSFVSSSSSSTSTSSPSGTICGADEVLGDFGCEPRGGSSSSYTASSSSKAATSSSSVPSSSSTADDNGAFSVATTGSVSASESKALASLLLGHSFHLHGSVVKDGHGSVIYVTASKNAYVYKGITEGSVVWSKNIAPEFTGIYPATGIVKFGTLADATDLVGPEEDLANQSVPIIGYMVHYKKADKAAWLAIDLNEKIMYKLSIIDGAPYRVELFGAQSDVMKSMLVDPENQTVSFGAAAVSSSSSSVAKSSSSSSSRQPVKECTDKGGSWDDDFGCSI